MRRHRIAAPLALATVLAAGATLFAPPPAAAQCLAESECTALKQRIRGLRAEARALKVEIRRLRAAIRALPEGPERAALVARARDLRRDLAELRRGDLRRAFRRYREGCVNC